MVNWRIVKLNSFVKKSPFVSKMDASLILYCILGIIVFNYLLENLLGYLNLRHAQQPLPQEIREIYSSKTLEKSLRYQKAVYQFTLVSGSVSFVFNLVLFAGGFFGWAYKEALLLVSDPIWSGLFFFFSLTLVFDLLSLPFQWFDTFVIEQKFGFNQTTLRTFFLDKIKGGLLMLLIGLLLGYPFFYLVLEIGASFWFWFWLLFIAFSLLMNSFYTTLILPLFNKLTPLQEGGLRNAIEAYCHKVNFPLNNLFVMDGSRRSTKSNAFFSGWGRRKKIILYDTLIQNHTTEELVAVLAHEVGHFKKKHVLLNFALSVLQTGAVLYLMSLVIFSPEMSLALGYNGHSIPLNLMVFSILFAPVSMLLGLFFNALSRNNEYEADRYAKNTYDGQALVNALKKISEHNLSNLYPHSWYVFFHYSHPTMMQRISALK